MSDDQPLAPARALHDSGYTDAELDAIFRSLVNGTELDCLETFVSALVIGLCDGDIVTRANGDTVRLRTPRAELDRRVAAIRAAMKEGATFRQAFCALPGE